MALVFTKKEVTQLLSEMVQKELDKAFDEELAKAADRVKERRDEIVARAALKISRYYRIETNQNNIVITVEDKQR